MRLLPATALQTPSGTKVLGKTLDNGVTGVYTLEEIENVISALVDHVDCQLIMALAFLGLRKGDCRAAMGMLTRTACMLDATSPEAREGCILRHQRPRSLSAPSR